MLQCSLTVLCAAGVRGVRDEDSLRYAVLELEPGPEPGAVRLRGVETGLYLAMDNRVRTRIFNI